MCSQWRLLSIQTFIIILPVIIFLGWCQVFLDGAYDVFMWIPLDLFHLSEGEFQKTSLFYIINSFFLVQNSLFPGTGAFEGIMSER